MIQLAMHPGQGTAGELGQRGVSGHPSQVFTERQVGSAALLAWGLLAT